MVAEHVNWASAALFTLVLICVIPELRELFTVRAVVACSRLWLWWRHRSKHQSASARDGVEDYSDDDHEDDDDDDDASAFEPSMTASRDVSLTRLASRTTSVLLPRIDAAAPPPADAEYRHGSVGIFRRCELTLDGCELILSFPGSAREPSVFSFAGGKTQRSQKDRTLKFVSNESRFLYVRFDCEDTLLAWAAAAAHNLDAAVADAWVIQSKARERRAVR